MSLWCLAPLDCITGYEWNKCQFIYKSLVDFVSRFKNSVLCPKFWFWLAGLIICWCVHGFLGFNLGICYHRPENELLIWVWRPQRHKWPIAMFIWWSFSGSFFLYVELISIFCALPEKVKTRRRPTCGRVRGPTCIPTANPAHTRAIRVAAKEIWGGSGWGVGQTIGGLEIRGGRSWQE